MTLLKFALVFRSGWMAGWMARWLSYMSDNHVHHIILLISLILLAWSAYRACVYVNMNSK